MRNMDFKGNAMEDAIFGENKFPYTWKVSEYFIEQYDQMGYMRLWKNSMHPNDEKKFLLDYIQGLSNEIRKLDAIVVANSEELEQMYNVTRKVLMKDFFTIGELRGHITIGELIAVTVNSFGENAFRLKQIFEGYLFSSYVDVRKSIDCQKLEQFNYPIRDWLEELEYKLSILPKTDSEIHELIIEATTGNNSKSDIDKVSWMVELGIIDHLINNYSAFQLSTNLMAKYLAKFVSVDAGTLSKYLSQHVNGKKSFNNTDFKNALIENGVTRKKT